MRPARFSAARAGAVRAVLTDFDGTLTTGGRLLPSTYRALSDLREAGLEVVLVTGRPAGWGEAFCRTFPVSAVITENGGVTFWPGSDGTLARTYGVATDRLPALRRRMHADAARVCRLVPGARLSSDSRYTEVDLAVDWNEEAHLPVEAARRIEDALRARGWEAVRSSVHVNFWPAGFDKRTACDALLARLGLGADDAIYVGDALNDAPLFGAYARSIGVRSVLALWDELPARPRFVTRADGGRGFEEVARAVLSARAAAGRGRAGRSRAPRLRPARSR